MKQTSKSGRKKLGHVGIYRNVNPRHIERIDKFIQYLKDEDVKNIDVLEEKVNKR